MSEHVSLIADLKAGKNLPFESAAAIEQLEQQLAEALTAYVYKIMLAAAPKPIIEDRKSLAAGDHSFRDYLPDFQ